MATLPGQRPALVSRPSLVYFMACSAGIGLGAVRTYFDLIDTGVRFQALGTLLGQHSAASPAAAPAAVATAPAAAATAATAASATPAAAWTPLRKLPPLPVPLGGLPALAAAPQATLGGLLSDARLIIGRMALTEVGLFVVLNWLVSVYCLTAVLTTRIFLGQLSSREGSRLTERLVKYVMFKAVFIGAVLTPSLLEVALWLGWFLLIGHVRLFVGAAKDRLEALLAAPTSSLGGRVRPFALVSILMALNAAGVASLLALASAPLGWQRVLLFAFDAAVVAAEGSKVLMRYVVHLMDQFALATEAASLRLALSEASRGYPPAAAATAAAAAAASSAPPKPRAPLGRWLADTRSAVAEAWQGWEGRGGFTYHAELAADVAVNSLTLCQYGYLWAANGQGLTALSLLLLVDVRCAVLALYRRLRAHMRYRAATHNVNYAFPDVPVEKLAAQDADCAICRERMSAAKHLPCGHHFHLPCLRAWLQQSGSDNFTCPVCRLPLFLAANDANKSGGNLSAWFGLSPQNSRDVSLGTPAVGRDGLPMTEEEAEQAMIAAALAEEEAREAAAAAAVAVQFAAEESGFAPGLEGAVVDGPAADGAGWMSSVSAAFYGAATAFAFGRFSVFGGGFSGFHRARAARERAFDAHVAAVLEAAAEAQRRQQQQQEAEARAASWRRRVEREREDAADEIETGWGIVGIVDDGLTEQLLGDSSVSAASSLTQQQQQQQQHQQAEGAGAVPQDVEKLHTVSLEATAAAAQQRQQVTAAAVGDAGASGSTAGGEALSLYSALQQQQAVLIGDDKPAGRAHSCCSCGSHRSARSSNASDDLEMQRDQVPASLRATAQQQQPDHQQQESAGGPSRPAVAAAGPSGAARAQRGLAAVGSMLRRRRAHRRQEQQQQQVPSPPPRAPWGGLPRRGPRASHHGEAFWGGGAGAAAADGAAAAAAPAAAGPDGGAPLDGPDAPDDAVLEPGTPVKTSV